MVEGVVAVIGYSFYYYCMRKIYSRNYPNIVIYTRTLNKKVLYKLRCARVIIELQI